MGEISEGLCREFHSSKTLGFTLCGVVPLSILQSMQKEKKKGAKNSRKMERHEGGGLQLPLFAPFFEHAALPFHQVLELGSGSFQPVLHV